LELGALFNLKRICRIALRSDQVSSPAVNSIRSLFRARWLPFVLAALALTASGPAKPSDWVPEIDALTATDAANPPPIHGIVFVGSSSIRLWENLAQDFPNLPVIRRGFGGSELADSVYFLDRLVIPYQPRTVVLYAGENDLKAGKTPEAIAADFDAFCTKLLAALPQTRIFYLSMKPSPSRWSLRKEMERGNALIAAACACDSRLTFVDVYSAMLDTDGQPRPELFRDDRLHMKLAGYEIWTKLLTPLLKP